mmetsp:Transcript_58709/g.126992  ORF Transcript_58709/g.126992 Transcript_58709/m.126992 type:complete len:344 (+) Transcript_58709:55-1086(+)
MPCDEGKWRLLNPLTIRFSQPRIAPHFRDGHLLDETTDEVYDCPMAEDAVSRPSLDAAEGVPPYDAILVAPFPAIRVISWMPKIRRPDGEAERDANGDQKLGKRAWFALDNRRLHILQCAAARRWPKRCGVVVRCIEEVPGGSTVRELRKFRTTTEGKSVEVGVRVGSTRPWTWRDVAPPGARQDVLPREGLFAEDLFDAEQWASHVVKICIDRMGSDQSVERSVDQSVERRVADIRSIEAEEKEAQNHKEVPRPQEEVLSTTAMHGYGWLVACPEGGWQYVDPAGRVQGPFPLSKMRQWFKHGFFQPTLPMRCDGSDAFVPFAELFPPPVEPFVGKVMRYSQ